MHRSPTDPLSENMQPQIYGTSGSILQKAERDFGFKPFSKAGSLSAEPKGGFPFLPPLPAPLPSTPPRHPQRAWSQRSLGEERCQPRAERGALPAPRIGTFCPAPGAQRGRLAAELRGARRAGRRPGEHQLCAAPPSPAALRALGPAYRSRQRR